MILQRNKQIYDSLPTIIYNCFHKSGKNDFDEYNIAIFVETQKY